MNTPIDLDEFKRLLLERRSELAGDSRQIRQDAHFGANNDGDHVRAPIHMADSASDTHDQGFAFERLAASSATLQEIDDALDRIEQGTYGQCEICANEIPLGRLKARPYASLCVDCKRKEEEG